MGQHEITQKHTYLMGYSAYQKGRVYFGRFYLGKRWLSLLRWRFADGAVAHGGRYISKEIAYGRLFVFRTDHDMQTTTKGTGAFVVVLANVAACLTALSQSVTSAAVFAE